MQETIERLKEEKQEFSKEWEQKGVELAQQWVREARLTEIEWYENGMPKMQERGDIWPDDEVGREYTDDLHCTETAYQSLCDGFVKGFKAYWGEIKKAI